MKKSTTDILSFLSLQRSRPHTELHDSEPDCPYFVSRKCHDDEDDDWDWDDDDEDDDD